MVALLREAKARGEVFPRPFDDGNPRTMDFPPLSFGIRRIMYSGLEPALRAAYRCCSAMSECLGILKTRLLQWNLFT